MTEPALLLCRTPLQARIFLRIAEFEGLRHPDVLYLTQHDSETDLLYFSRLEGIARSAQYLRIRSSPQTSSTTFWPFGVAGLNSALAHTVAST